MPDFNLPAWMTPEGEASNHFKWLDEERQTEQANTQKTVALGQLALSRQREDLNQKIGASTLIAQGLAIQEAELQLQDNVKGRDEWNNILQSTGGDPEKIYQSPPPTSAFALQKWTAARAGYAQSVSGAAKVRLVSDFHTKLAQLDDEGFTSVNDMMQADGGMNPDGTPTNMVLQELANQGQRMIDQKREQEIKVRQAGPEITTASRERVAQIQAGARTEAAQIAADAKTYSADAISDARKYATDASKQISADKLAAALQNKSYDFLPHAEYDRLHQQMEDIRKTADPADRQRLLERAFNDAVNAHQARLKAAAVPNVTVAPPPQATSDAELAKAQAAIKSGKDPEAVKALYKKKTGKDFPTQ